MLLVEKFDIWYDYIGYQTGLHLHNYAFLFFFFSFMRTFNQQADKPILENRGFQKDVICLHKKNEAAP